MSQAIITRPEHCVVVTRQNSPSVYYKAFLDSNKVVATGSCGVGKSTHALAGMLSVEQDISVLIIQPNSAAVKGFNTAYDRVAKDNGFTVMAKRTVRTAKHVVDRCIGDSQYFKLFGMVVVDEFHLTDPYVATVTQLVRQHCPKYLLISASVRHRGSDEHGHTNFSVEKDRSVVISGNMPKFTGTVYDPTMWASHIKTVVVYPMTDLNVTLLKKMYRAHGVAVVDEFSGTSRQVLMLRSTDDVGRTLHADMLLDSGYIESNMSIDRVFSRTVRPLTRGERAQRWSRVGRLGYKAVIVHCGSTEDREISDWERESTAITMRAANCDASAVRDIHGIKLNHYSRDFASKAVRSSNDTMTEYELLMAESRPTLYEGKTLSLPCKYVDNTGATRSYYQMSFNGKDSGFSFTRAKSMYAAAPNMYWSALFALLYGEGHVAKNRVNKPYHECVSIPSTVMRLSHDEIRSTRSMVDYDVEGSKKVYRARINWTACEDNTLNSPSAYDSQKPQRRFAAAVKYLHALPRVAYKYKNGSGTVHDLLTKQHPLSGGNDDMKFNVIAQFAKRHGCAVAILPVRHFDKPPAYTSLSGVRQYLHEVRANNAFVSPLIIAVRYMWSSNGTILVNSGGKAMITGIDVYKRCINTVITEASKAVITMVGSLREYKVLADDEAMVKPSKRNRTVTNNAVVKTDEKTDAQRLLEWYNRTGVPFMIVHEEIAEDSGLQWGTLFDAELARKAMTRRATRNLESIVLMVSYEHDRNGTFKVDGYLCSMNNVALAVLPDHEMVMDEVNMAVHCSKGDVTCVNVQEVAEVSTIVSCSDFKSVFHNNHGVGSSSWIFKSNGDGSPVSVNDSPVSEVPHISGGSSLDGVDFPLPSSDDESTPVKYTPSPGTPSGLRRDLSHEMTMSSPALSGGADTGKIGSSTANDDMVIDLSGEDVMKASAENDAGNMLSKEDFAAIRNYVSKEYSNVFYVSLLDYLIKTDASSNISPSATTTIKGKKYKWEQVFAEIRQRCASPPEFHVRKYARTLGATFINLWINGDYFKKMRESANFAMRGRAGLSDVDTIYTLSFMEHLIPTERRRDIALYHQSRKIAGNENFVGAVKNFTAQTDSTDVKQGGVQKTG